MPGLSFVYDFKGHLHQKESRILRSLDSIIHGEDYEKKILLKENSYFLASTNYKEYPLTYFESAKYIIYLEGKIYGKDHASVNDELNVLADWLSQSPIQKQGDITQWLLNTDGDFILFIFDKKSPEILILNDALGRLPLYYSRTDDELIVSREVRFIANLRNIKRLDRMAIAQYLLFSFPLGERTLLDQIKRWGRATLLTINIRQSTIRTHNFDSFHLETKEHEGKSLEQNAAELVSLFSQACKDRTTSSSKNILALSGGLDSRCVAACLRKNKIPFSAATRFDYDKQVNLDAKIAEQLARLFDIDWRFFRLDPPKGKDLARLIRIKSGLNYLAVSFILPFFDKIKDTFGSEIIYWTGDGGDKVKTDLRPSRSFASLDSLTEYIVAMHQVFSLPTVVALTQVAKCEILENIKSQISGYPEKDLRQKYIRFLVQEKGLRWNFEGEDRNRFYFWSVTPFYSVPFFKYAMGCPDEQKAGHALYRAFLAKLSPDAAALDNANWGFSLDSKKYIFMSLLKRLVLDKLSPHFRRKLKQSAKNYGPSRYRDAMRLQLSNCNAIGNYLSAQMVESALASSSTIQVQTLLTITSVIEEMECGKSTLENLSECDFA